MKVFVVNQDGDDLPLAAFSTPDKAWTFVDEQMVEVHGDIAYTMNPTYSYYVQIFELDSGISWTCLEENCYAPAIGEILVKYPRIAQEAR